MVSLKHDFFRAYVFMCEWPADGAEGVSFNAGRGAQSQTEG